MTFPQRSDEIFYGTRNRPVTHKAAGVHRQAQTLAGALWPLAVEQNRARYYTAPGRRAARGVMLDGE
jgi:hypothetical protein